MALHTLSICTGAAMLDLGFHIAAERTGIGTVRPVLYVEREAYAAANLVAKMEAGVLDAAPIWSDVATLTGPECGSYLDEIGVDAIVGGIPCQPFSVAGKRLYSDDPRDLLGKTLQLVERFAPQWVALENVAGFVVPDGLGRLAEGLEILGYDVAAILLSARDVGASHRRARVFILAHGNRVERGSVGRRPNTKSNGRDNFTGSGPGMADAQRGRPGGRSDGDSPGGGGQIQTAGRCSELGYSECGNGQAGQGSGCYVASNLCCESKRTKGVAARGKVLFAPANNDTQAWLQALQERPELCPSLPRFTVDAGDDEALSQSAIRRMADGMARAMVERQHRLRMCGNGVVPLQAAVAYSILFNCLQGGGVNG